MNRMLKNGIKSAIKRAMGNRLGRRTVDFIAMARSSHLAEQVRPGLLERVFFQETVLNGPFRGMKFPYHHWCKLLGSYEEELHEMVERLCAGGGYKQIVNIGAAEGYYTVGLARRNPGAQIISFEMDGVLSRIAQEIAVKNQVQGQITFRGRCDLPDLQGLDYSKPTLIVCDCDSYEWHLLKPEEAPGLRCCDVLVETHDCLRAGITAELQRRFEGSHHLTVIKERRKEAHRYPQLENLSPFEQEVCLSEDRISADIPYVMEWFFLKARGASSDSSLR